MITNSGVNHRECRTARAITLDCCTTSSLPALPDMKNRFAPFKYPSRYLYCPPVMCSGASKTAEADLWRPLDRVSSEIQAPTGILGLATYVSMTFLGAVPRSCRSCDGWPTATVVNRHKNGMISGRWEKPRATESYGCRS